MVRANDQVPYSFSNMSPQPRFGVETAEKLVNWALKFVPPEVHASILEIGSGNGMLLFALMDAGYAPCTIAGIDYSPEAVSLARSIASTRGADRISFAVCDFLKDNPPPLSTMKHKDGHALWDLLLDKGTFDAIALGKKDESGKSPAADYPVQVAKLLTENGYLLITCVSFLRPSQPSIIYTTTQHATSQRMN